MDGKPFIQPEPVTVTGTPVGPRDRLRLWYTDAAGNPIAEAFVDIETR